MSSTTKKQNRILLAVLVVILASAAILIAVTGSANKKTDEENPPLVKNSETSKESEQTGKVKESTDGGSKDSSDVKKPANAVTKPDSDTINEKIEPKKDDKTAETKESAKNTDKEVASVVEDVLPQFVAPVAAAVIKPYSDSVPVFSYTMNDYRVHNALDFAASVGTPVCASADGVIAEVIDDPMMGATVSVSHSGGAKTVYKGLSEDALTLHKPGDEVARGEVLGAVGDTALIESAEEEHLHFEMTINGESVDPAEYMEVSYLTDMNED